MAEFPADRSFVRAAADAVVTAGFIPIEMEHFAARDAPPAEVCTALVRQADIYLGIIGFRYGSIVPGSTGISYTELEFSTASESGQIRLIFMLDESALLPRSIIDHDAREIDRFREFLERDRILVRRFKSADALEREVLKALIELRSAWQASERGSTDAARSRPPVSALPILPSRYVPRPKLFEDISTLLSQQSPPSTSVVGLVGMGGAGKSTLARALARSDGIQEKFQDGVVWVDVGPRPDVRSCLRRIATLFGDLQPITDAEAGRERVSRLLGHLNCLVILDNVWSIGDLRALDFSTSTVRLLVTTRNRDCLYADTDISLVGPVDELQAKQLLGRYSGTSVANLPPESAAIISYCGGLALALAIAGGLVAEGRRWTNVAERMRRSDLAKLTARFKDYPHPDLLRALEASVMALPDEYRARYRELAVFESRGLVPTAIVKSLWAYTANLDDLDSEDLILSLSRRSLVQWDPLSDTVTLHDLLFNYVRSGLAPDLIAATHGSLTRAVLKGWGGFESGLPRLQSASASSNEDRYAVQNLVYHLASSDDTSMLHELLGIEWRQGEARTVNAWFATHDRAGWDASYIADLETAWGLAERTTDASMPSRGRPKSLGLEVRYALIRSSISSIAASLPPPLITRLVQTGRWDFSQALTYVDAIPDPRMRTLARVDLAPFLPSHLLSSVLETVRGIADIHLRVWAVTMTVKSLRAVDRAVLLKPELDRSREIVEASERIRAVTTIAAQLPIVQRRQLLESELRLARAIDTTVERVRAVVAVATQLSIDERFRIVQSELSIARALVDDGERVRAVVALAAQVPIDQRPAILQPELDLAVRIPGVQKRIRLTCSIACLFDANLRRRLLRVVLSELHKIPSEYARIQILEMIAPFVDGDLLDVALTVATDMHEPWASVKAVATLAPYLKRALKHSLLNQALSTTAALESPFYRAYALMAVISILPPNLLSQALEIIATIDRPSDRANLLGLISPRLPEHLLTRSLDIARTIERAPDGAQALADLTPHLPVAERTQLLSPVISAISSMADNRGRAKVLAFLAPHLPVELLDEAVGIINISPERPEDAASSQAPPGGRPVSTWSHLFAPALNVVPSIQNVYYRAQALAALAPQLPEDLQIVALAAANEISDPYGRTWALAGFAPHSSADQREELLSAALQAALGIDDDFYRAQALAGLAPHVGGRNLRALAGAAIESVMRVDNLAARGVVIRTLLPHLPRNLALRMLDKAMDLLEDLDDDSSRAELLTLLAPYLSPAQVRQALDVARRIESSYFNAMAMSGLAPQLRGRNRSKVLREAVESVRAVENLSSGGVSARPADGATSPELRWRNVRAMLKAAANRNRRSTFDLIPQACEAAEDLEADILAQALDALRQVQRWWP